MKQLKQPIKIFLYVIMAVIIVAGAIVVALNGFNVELAYRANQKVELVIGEIVEDTSKIQEKADEVFGTGNSTVQVVELFKDAVQITAREISEEQKKSLVEKVNELYPQEVKEGEKETKLLDASKITIENSGNARLRDFLAPYLVPVVLATVAVLAYYGIRYRKLGVIKVIFKSLLTIALAELVLISLLAIVRFPMGRLTAPLVLLVYVSALIYTSGKLIKLEKESV